MNVEELIERLRELSWHQKMMPVFIKTGAGVAPLVDIVIETGGNNRHGERKAGVYLQNWYAS